MQLLDLDLPWATSGDVVSTTDDESPEYTAALVIETGDLTIRLSGTLRDLTYLVRGINRGLDQVEADLNP